MPPSAHTLSLDRQIRHTESAAIKLWLIHRMNRKADSLPPRLVLRMLELYHIRPDELDPRIAAKLRAAAPTLGHEDANTEIGIEEFDSVEALSSLRSSFRAHNPISIHPVPVQSGITHTTRNPHTNPKPRPKPTPAIRNSTGANPRAWRKSRSEPIPTDDAPTESSNSHSYSFPPYSAQNAVSQAQISNPCLVQRTRPSETGAKSTSEVVGSDNSAVCAVAEYDGEAKEEGKERGRGREKGKRGRVFVSLFGGREGK
ncbi:hypothetical protein ACMFMF_006226 [Clarireedia jacksonii]